MSKYPQTCPFCGGDAELKANYSYKIRCYFVFVKCEICGAQGKVFKSSNDPQEDNWQSDPCESAITAWNMRTYENASSSQPPIQSDEDTACRAEDKEESTEGEQLDSEPSRNKWRSWAHEQTRSDRPPQTATGTGRTKPRSGTEPQ